jgi:hypothetical protein
MLVPFKAGLQTIEDNNYLEIRLAALHKKEKRKKNEIERIIVRFK